MPCIIQDYKMIWISGAFGFADEDFKLCNYETVCTWVGSSELISVIIKITIFKCNITFWGVQLHHHVLLVTGSILVINFRSSNMLQVKFIALRTDTWSNVA